MGVEHKLIRDYEVTDASVHDSQVFEELLGAAQDNSDVYADSAYRSKQTEEDLMAAGYTSHVHERPYRNTPLTESQQAANHERSKIRVRVEHVFGSQLQLAGDLILRSIGIARAKAKNRTSKPGLQLESLWLPQVGSGEGIRGKRSLSR